MTTLGSPGTAIVYDSTADLPVGGAGGGSWTMVPLTVSFGNESFRDYVDLDASSFYRRLEASTTSPTTSQPTPAAFAEVYEALLAEHDQVLSLHLAGTLSGTVESARLAAAEHPGRVHVRDTGTVSIGLATRVRVVQEMLDAGTTLEEVDGYLDGAEARSRVRFAVATLEYLQRGGRIGRASALVGGMLSVKPITSIEHGRVVPVRRVRGARKVIPALVEELEDFLPAGGAARLAITHSAVPDEAEALARALRSARPVLRFDGISELGPVVGTHAGPGTLAWFVERTD